MAQAGIHAIVGAAVRRWAPGRTWLVLGIVLGSLLPDADNLAVAVTTVTKLPTEGVHRTFTHSLFTVAAVIIVFNVVSIILRSSRWRNLGLGLGLGILLHILLDLVIWFNGVAILWPLSSWINFWSVVTPPAWFEKLMLPAEFLFMGLFFAWLAAIARKQGTDQRYSRTVSLWAWVQLALFLVFTLLVYAMQSGFLTIYGLVYLLSLGLAIYITIRMRETLEGSRFAL